MHHYATVPVVGPKIWRRTICITRSFEKGSTRLGICMSFLSGQDWTVDNQICLTRPARLDYTQSPIIRTAVEFFGIPI